MIFKLSVKTWHLEDDASVKLTIIGNRYYFKGSGQEYDVLVDYLEDKQGDIRKTETGYETDNFVVNISDDGKVLLIQKSDLYSTVFRFVKG